MTAQSKMNPLKKNKFRNLPCPCQSGQKFKKCCWSREPDYINPYDLISKNHEARAYKATRTTLKNFKRMGITGRLKRSGVQGLTKKNKSFITKLIDLVSGRGKKNAND